MYFLDSSRSSGGTPSILCAVMTLGNQTQRSSLSSSPMATKTRSFTLLSSLTNEVFQRHIYRLPTGQHVSFVDRDVGPSLFPTETILVNTRNGKLLSTTHELHGGQETTVFSGKSRLGHDTSSWSGTTDTESRFGRE